MVPLIAAVKLETMGAATPRGGCSNNANIGGDSSQAGPSIGRLSQSRFVRGLKKLKEKIMNTIGLKTINAQSPYAGVRSLTKLPLHFSAHHDPNLGRLRGRRDRGA
jgi:hypothetical protein